MFSGFVFVFALRAGPSQKILFIAEVASAGSLSCRAVAAQDSAENAARFGLGGRCASPAELPAYPFGFLLAAERTCASVSGTGQTAAAPAFTRDAAEQVFFLRS